MNAHHSFAAAGCFALLLLASPLSAGIRPSFFLEECVWPATDIVVGVQGSERSASWTVLETWKGDLVKGATIEVVGLPAAPIEVSTMFAPKPVVKFSVGGGRIILFLKHAAPPRRSASATQPAAGRYEGASPYGGAQVSAVWVEKDQGYAFQQIINPGPSELHPLRQSEGDLKKETLVMLAAQDKLRKARAI